MIGLIITLATIGGALVLATILGVFALIQTGRIALPNSPQRRVQHAKVEAQLAELDLRRVEANREAAEMRFKIAQTEASRQLMEAQSLEKLAEIHDLKFAKALTEGGTKKADE